MSLCPTSRVWAAVFVSVVIAASAAAQPLGMPEEVRHVPYLTGEIDVDGVIQEPAWRDALAVTLDWEVRPGHNLPAIVATECFITYDSRAVYVACRAFDPNPEAIRAHLTDRDDAWRDDYIGVLLDTFNDERRAFGFYVNPLGVQMDIIRNDSGTGDEFDPSWDAIWWSEGRITPDGYEIELAIPFTSLRFQRSEGPQTWGVYLYREYPRNIRREFGSIRIDRNRNCLLCQADKMSGFEEAHPGRNLELNPTLTGTRTEVRKAFPDGDFEVEDEDIEIGLTALWGVTPNLTLAGTLNPDFSQVEADAAKLDVNRRFAIFFEEKRPFFLEGTDFFDTFFDAVHTRTVVAPDWGVKLTGKERRSAVGAFVAEDSITNILIPGSERSFLQTIDGGSTDAVARYRRDVGSGSAVGVLFTGRRGEDYASLLGGFDAFFRISDRKSLQLQVLSSETEYPDEVAAFYGQPLGSFGDLAYRARLQHESRDLYWTLRYEDVGDDFRADLGFMPQVGYRQYGVGGQRSWWGDHGEWYTRVFLGASWGREENQRGGLLYDGAELWTGFYGPLQSWVRYEVSVRSRGYEGVEFDETTHHLRFQIRPSGAFDFDLVLRYADDIDYEHVRPGTELRFNPWMTLRLGRHLKLFASHELERLDVAGGRLYEVALSELRAVYQFSTRTFVRAILQYEDLKRDPALYDRPVSSHREKLFTQLLFSYTINPKTVLFAGYSDNYLGAGAVDLTQLDRTVFLKLGYAWVF
jgi:hypothetical protein